MITKVFCLLIGALLLNLRAGAAFLLSMLSHHNSIGNLNHLFFWPELYRRIGEMSIAFLFDENPGFAIAGSGGAAVGEGREVFRVAPLAQTQSERRRRLALGNGLDEPRLSPMS